MIHGLVPGPLLFEKAPDVVYGLYGGLLAANILMVLVGLVILSPCIWLVNRPKPYLIAFILALVCTGVFAIEQSLFDLGLVLTAGVVGYAMRRFGVPILPVVLGVVLGFMVESNYRRSLVLSDGDHFVFLEDPVSLGLLSTAILLTLYSFLREFKAK
jgi:putative tricarboxylic transport membrane protein